MKKIYKYILALILLLVSVYLFDKYLPALFTESLPKSNRIIVVKSDRELFLLKDSTVIKKFKISLGKNPVGDKLKENDSKTPEGSYIIDWKNNRSKFHKSLHISYPGKQDILEVAQKGYNPGGNIMILVMTLLS